MGRPPVGPFRRGLQWRPPRSWRPRRRAPGGLSSSRGPRWLRRFLVWGISGFAVAAAVGVVAAVVVSRTAAGREAALDWALSTLRPSVNGSVAFESVGPGGLLGGATLRGVRVEDHLGRAVLTADSVRARYSLFDLLGGGRAIADLRLWSPVATIRPGVERLLARNADSTGPHPPGSADSRPDEAPRPLLRIRGVRLHDGAVILEGPERPPRRIDGIEGDLARVDVSPGEGVHLAAEVADAALSYPARSGRIGLAAFRGSATIGRDGVSVVANAFRLAGSEGSGRAFAERAGAGWRFDVEASLSELALADLAWIDPRLDHGSAAGDVRVVWEPGRLAVSTPGSVEVDLGGGGRLRLGGEVVRDSSTRFRGLRVEAQALASAEVERWTAAPLPVAGAFSGDMRVDGSPARLALAGTAALADPAAGETLASAAGAATVLGRFAFEDADVELDPFDYGLLRAVAPGVRWSGRGSVHVRADGDLREGVAVEVSAEHRSASAGDSSVAVVSGTLFGDTAVAVLDLDATLAPLSLAALRDALPACRPSGGDPPAPLDAPASTDGDDAGAAAHAPRAVAVSAATPAADTPAADISEAPAQAPAEAPVRCRPRFDLAGAVRGSVSLAGPLDRLAVSVSLDTPGGPVSGEGSANALDLSDGYEFAASFDAFRLSDVVPSLPQPTVATGSVRLSGHGLDRNSLRGSASASVRSSTVGPLALDSAEASAWVEDGVLHMQSLLAATEGLTLAGHGSLGLRADAQGEGLALSLRSPSVRPLRSILMGPNLVARDELTALERSIHEMDGADPDTFPTAREIRLDGALEGRVDLQGGLEDLSMQVSASFDGPAYRWHSAAAASVEAAVSGIRLLGPDSAAAGRDDRAQGSANAAAGPARTDEQAALAGGHAPGGTSRFAGVVVEGTFSADSLVLGGRAFESARVEGSYEFAGRAQARIRVARTEDERYEAEGAASLDGPQRSVTLDRLELAVGSDHWALDEQAMLAWGPAGVEVAEFSLSSRSGDFSARADGRIAGAEGGSSLEVDVAGLDLGALGRLLQADNWPAGRISARARLRGPAESPRWTGELRATNARYETLAFDAVVAEAAYDGGSVAGSVEASTGGRRALVVDGSLPADFRLGGAPRPRIPDGVLALDIAADSLPAALVLGVVASLEEIGGVVDGRVQVGGRLSAPQPSGGFRLAGGTARLAPLGVRLSGLELDFGVTPDGVVAVAGSGNSGGPVRIQGTIDVARPADPVFDLAFWPRELQIVDRRDMVAAVSGDSITLTGSFNYPLIQGALAVDGGTVFVEELRRSSEVVDFYDHALSAAARTVALAGGRRAESDIELSPFLSNLRVLVDVDIGRGSWLRSRDLNVETEGALVVTFDRENNQLILQGDMGVVRGTYSRLPRTLNITGGLFRFLGRTPDFNPEIAITAETRLRTRGGQPLTITAGISGSLVAPQVVLSSDAESAISEADLYSYLLLGQPTSALLGQPRATSVGAGTNFLFGQVASQIGYLLALRLDVDHLSVSQAEQTQANAAFGASSLQIEVGRYVVDNVFLTGVYQRGICADPKLPVNSVGVRLEVDMPRDMTLEGFLEDRCTRQGFRGLGGLSLERAQIWGIAFYRDWGY